MSEQNKKLRELSLFFPFWNEEKNIEQVVLKARDVAEKVAQKWEIIMVDDGSKDDTLKLAKELAKKNKNFKIISHSPNRGYGAALKEGFANARYKYIVFTDGDNQYDISEVVRFIPHIDEYDFVIGYRKKRMDTFQRHVLMNLLKIWDYIFFGFYFKDIDCGFKMLNKSSLEKIMPLRSEGAMITTEILAKAQAKKLKIKQVEISHFPRTYGESSGGNVSVIVRAVLETLILWWDIHNARI